MNPIFRFFSFGTFQFSGKNGFLAAIFCKFCLKKIQGDLGLEAAKFRAVTQSLGQINDSVVRFERGELVRGFHLPVVYIAGADQAAVKNTI